MKPAFLTILFIFASACANVSDLGQLPKTNYAGWQNSSPAENSLSITVLDVGQGDATFIHSSTGVSILIDAGPLSAGKNVILPFLKSLGVGKLDAIILTHYHEDHLGGLMEVLNGEDGLPNTDDDIKIIGDIYDRGEPKNYPEAPAFPVYETSTVDRRRTANPGEHVQFGDIDVEIMAANGELADGNQVGLGEEPDENASSVALLVRYSGFKMFIGADITGGGGTPPYDTPDIETPLSPIVGDIDVLRVAHHGSGTSTGEAFLNVTKPEVAIISLGDGNDYYHPHKSVIDRLLTAGIAVYQTEKGWLKDEGSIVANGNIVVNVDKDGKYEVKTGLNF